MRSSPPRLSENRQGKLFSLNNQHSRLLLITLTVFSIAVAPLNSFAQNTNTPAASNSGVLKPKRAESRRQWFRDGERAVQASKRLRARGGGRARNVILFVGDGMGVATVTAARILEGQQGGASGEENLLSFERFPYVALSKTYSANQQTSDSAPTMTAIITGVKSKDGTLSVAPEVTPGDHTSVEGNALLTLIERGEQAGLATGVVSTARITHATPAACYAHTPERDWECDADLAREARADGFPDIARQLVEHYYGDGLEVALGGGRSKFLPKETVDPEYADQRGERLDARDLTREWTAKRRGAAYVWNKRDFDRINPRRTPRLLGLFERAHMRYEHDRVKDTAGEPSLSEMTAKAIDILAQNPKGYVLMVEGGRIDHAHHDGNAYRALTETIELSNAVRTALAKVDLNDTLVVVTADHSHAFNMVGYPTRGNPIMGLVRQNDSEGNPARGLARDSQGKPYTTLGYANGPGARASATRPDLTDAITSAPDYLQEATVPMSSETHGGEDVAIYADGPGAHLFHGVQEQNYIFHVMLDALGLNRRRRR